MSNGEERDTSPETPDEDHIDATPEDLPESETIGFEGTDADTADLSEELERLTKEVEVLKDALLRARAETENVRRRAEKDKSDASAYAVTGFARDMLTVTDNLRRALDALPDERADDMTGFIEGVELTERELLNTFERHSIQKVKPEPGDKFDPNRHQAMFEIETADFAPGSVVQVVNAGYVIKDRLLRPAMVGVAKGVATKVDEAV